MTETRAVWSTAYVNSLPDSSFLLVVGSGADKQRYFPVKDADGKVDAAHLANALARIPQASTLSADQRMAAMTKAKALAKGTSVSGSQGTYAGSAGSGRTREPAPLLVRTFDVDLEVRDDGEGRTLFGRAVPYGETINLPGGDGKERFAYGAFARQVAAGQFGGIKLFDSHQNRMSGQQPIGKTAMLAEREDGLHGAWPLYNTSRANDALELVRTGEVTGLSIGFKVTGKPTLGADGAYERTAAHLDHIVLTHEPAYASAGVTAIRSAHPIAGFKVAQARAHQLLERLG
jgi:HK97 family phage prohead protease